MSLLFEEVERAVNQMPQDLVAQDLVGQDLVAQDTRRISLLEFFGVEEGTTHLEGGAQATGDPESESDRWAAERARQLSIMVEAARAEAVSATRQTLEAESAAELRQERVRVDQLCGEFARDRQRYFAAAETQVVRLALAVARRVLAHEIARDPFHLASVVKLALAKIQDGSTTLLRVAPGETNGWEAVLSDLTPGSIKIVPDVRLPSGECVLETAVGRIELGVEVQLAEIDRAFQELLPNRGNDDDGFSTGRFGLGRSAGLLFDALDAAFVALARPCDQGRRPDGRV